MTAPERIDRDRLLEHSYDGIQEYENPLPRWWVVLFWGTIVFSILYALNVPGIGIGKGRIAEYEARLARHRELLARQARAGGPSAEELAAAAVDPSVLASGAQLFAQNCAACHRADGGGLIGPNLTDDYWIHGGTLSEIRKTIDEGVLTKGMPAWGKVLQPPQITALAAYVYSLRGSNPADPKPPEGARIER
jgi:cytochrome c oxidase cbb3-type subunit 3